MSGLVFRSRQAGHRIVKQITSTGQEWKFSYKRAGACVAKIFETLRQTAGASESFAYTCRAGQSLSSRVCTGANGASTAACTEPVVGTCPEVDSDESRAAGWRFYGGVNVETRVTHPSGQQTLTKFNAKGQPLEEVDELGQVTRHDYDAHGRKVRTVDPLGRETRYAYDAAGHRVATVDPLGRRVDTPYDAQSNKPLGATRYLLGVPSTQGAQTLSYTPVPSTLGYDVKGNLTSVLDAGGFITRLGYDGRGQLQQVTLPVRVGATQVPVVQEGIASSVLPATRTLRLGYNAAGDLALSADPLGHATRIDSDALGRPSQVTDPLGYSTRMHYDRLDRQVRQTDALDQDSRLDYDSAGRLVAVVNPAGVAIERYTYDAQGRITRVTDALGQSTDVAHDTTGRPERITDRKGQVTRIAYNARGQVSAVSRPDQEVHFTYDAAARLTHVRDNASTTTWQYDAADRVVQVDTTTAAGSHRLRYDHDSLDRITRRTLSGTGIAQPEVTDYAWDLSGRLLSITTAIAGQSHQTRFEYDSAGRLAARQVQAGDQPDALTQRYGWDAADRLTQIRYLRGEGTAGEQLIEQIDYAYDARGQRIARTTLNSHGTGLPDTPMQASYDAANRMTRITLKLPEGDKHYNLTHDANGNLTGKTHAQDAADTTQYRWDASNRLVGIIQPGLQASFVYDALGRRIQASITREGQSPSTVQYLYEGLQALGEIREGKLTHRLLVALQLDEVIARLAVSPSGQKDAAGSRLYLTDALNSVIAQLGDEAGATLKNSYAYSPYGESQTLGVDTSANPIQYTGRENDGTGLYYYRARYMWTGGGRFISEDPIGLEGGTNAHLYAEANPMMYTDPLGLWVFGDPLPQGLVDACAGFGDGVSLGTTAGIRGLMGTNDAVDFSSPEYLGGMVAGVAVTTRGYLTGAELSIGRNVRIAPWGNRTGHPTGRYPHYHRRGAADANGNTPAGQGIGRHRPWDTKSADKCVCDRF